MQTEFTSPGGESLAFVNAVVGRAPGKQSSSPSSAPASKEPKNQTYPAHAHLPLIVLITLLVGMALAFVWLHLAMPFGNDRLQPGTNAITARGVVVTPLEAGPAGLQAGDIVTAISGRSLQLWLEAADSSLQVGDTIDYSVIRQGQATEVAVTLERYPLGAVLRREWGTVIFRTLSLLIAAYVFVRRPRLTTARLLFLGTAALFSAMPWSLGLHAGDFVNGVGVWLFHLTVVGAFMLAWIANFHFALVFPRPVGFLKKRWVLPVIYGLPYIVLALYLLATQTQATNLVDWMGRWEWFTGPHAAVFLSLTFVTVIWQYRANTSGVTRQQIRLLVLAAMLVAGVAVVFYFLPLLAGVPALDSNVMGLIGILFPLAVAISILRHNLFDIDTLLNRALVYGGLTTVVIALYTVVVSLLSTFFQAGGNLFVALVATGLVAILFQPLRERLQRAVNRLMYGERDEPFEVLARLGERLESTLAPGMVYPTIVETVAQTLKLPYAAIAVKQEGHMLTVESYGKPAADPITYPLTHQGIVVGQLLVARRGPDEDFSEADQRLLRNIARQAGTAVHAVQLTADLQRSRQQLVAAREEERRRLRRDLHDGLGPHLASQTLTIDAIGKLLTRNPERAQALLQDLKAQSQTAVQDIRRLVYDLRPPALDELGLVGALQEGAARQSQNGPRITVEAESPLPPLPAAVEVAAFRIAQEAVNNVVRHAQAQTCTVQLELEQSPQKQGDQLALCLQIVDDGRGFAPDARAGVGLHSMRERASELGGTCHIASPAGGGTRVSATLPLPAP